MRNKSGGSNDKGKGKAKDHDREDEDDVDYEVIELDMEGVDIGQLLFALAGAGGATKRRIGGGSSRPQQRGLGVQTRSAKKPRGRQVKFVNPCAHLYGEDEMTYYNGLNTDEQVFIADTEQRILDNQDCKKPLRFRILESGVDDYIKSIAMRKLDVLYTVDPNCSEYHKVMNWIDALCRLPINKYAPLTVGPKSPIQEKQLFLSNTRSHLDKVVYGHKDAKEHILRLLAQWITKPDARGMVIGLVGPAGIGKTQFALQGISKALNIPFAFITLGGANDCSVLDGFAVTYEGSTYGRIAEVLMKAGVCNPVLYFDELDKVSETSRGEEITNLLIHLTDPSQNAKFTDKYFSDIPIDLSRCLMIFSYNDIERVSPILRDRMYCIDVKGYEVNDKLQIARRHLLPDICNEYAIAMSDIEISDDVLKYIIAHIAPEQGVRGLKRALNVILGDLNLRRVIQGIEAVPFPAVIRIEDIVPVLKTLRTDDRHILHSSMYI
jgi:ATP-dependent Lon protease